MNINKAPLVTIACITYNQKKYISDAIEGFLKQKTNFQFEIIIHDDASTDGTDKIIRSYKKKYPNLINPIYQTENQYSKGKGIFQTYLLPIAKGKYIALCEGDDYWTDSLKLQKQVDYIEKNKGCSLCFHKTVVYYNNKKKILRPIRRHSNIYTIYDIILSPKTFVATSSMIFKKNDILNMPKWVLVSPRFHGEIMLFMATRGFLGFIDESMSVYRYMSDGSLSSRHMSSWKMEKNRYDKLKHMWTSFDNWTDRRYRFYIAIKLFIEYLRAKRNQIKLMIKEYV